MAILIHFEVLGLTQPRFKPITYHMQSEHSTFTHLFQWQTMSSYYLKLAIFELFIFTLYVCLFVYRSPPPSYTHNSTKSIHRLLGVIYIYILYIIHNKIYITYILCSLINNIHNIYVVCKTYVIYAIHNTLCKHRDTHED